MIIKLKGADFSANNINSLLNSWPITFYGRTLVTGTFTSSVSKGETYTATFSVAENCTVDSVTITRGGTTMSGATISDGTISISVPTTTESGPISITFVGSREDGGDVVDPEEPGTGDGETNLTSQFSWTPGAIIWENGQDREDTNWLHSNYVDIGDYSQLRFTHIQTTTSGTSLGYAFYDSSKGYISGANNSGTSFAPVEKTIDVPSGAKYFRTMWINTTNTNYNASIHDTNKFYCYGID